MSNNTTDPDERDEWCRECQGDGGWAVPIGVDYTNGSVIERWDRCPACDGKRETKVEFLPVTIEEINDEPF